MELDLTPAAKAPRVLNEAAIFKCVSCGKPLGTQKMIEMMLGKLAGHSMFAAPGSLDRLKMCADCRVEAVVNEGFDPHAAAQRPPVMTTEDYLRARDANKDDPLGS